MAGISTENLEFADEYQDAIAAAVVAALLQAHYPKTTKAIQFTFRGVEWLKPELISSSKHLLRARIRYYLSETTTDLTEKILEIAIELFTF